MLRKLYREESEMRKQSGFTLVELVAVIVLLGILAVAALPRFIDLRGDARNGVLQGAVGSAQSAAVQIYAKALIQNSLTAASTVTDGASTVGTVFGYPAANDLANEDISDLISVDGDASLIFEAAVAGATRELGYDDDGDGAVDDDGCYVTYTNSAAAGTLPAIAITDSSGC